MVYRFALTFEITQVKKIKKTPLLFAIVGPTCVGKTSMAHALARQSVSDIVSADARQIYKELDIGTDKPTQEERQALQTQGIHYHFIDSHSISQPLSAGSYGRECIALLRRIYTTQNHAYLVGGSFLYIDAVCEGFSPLPHTPMEKWRSLAKAGDLKALQAYVCAHDRTQYERMDIQNAHRLARVAEVIEQSGIPYSTLLRQKPEKRFFKTHYIGLYRDRTTLYQRIAQRAMRMIHHGLWQEARKLFHAYKDKNQEALPKTIGYHELFRHFEGLCSQKEAETLYIRNTRRYAKRQMTWLRSKKEKIRWFHADQKTAIHQYITEQRHDEA